MCGGSRRWRWRLRPACRRCGSRPGSAAHLGDRPLQVARDVDRERLERGDVKRVQPAIAANIRPVEMSLRVRSRGARPRGDTCKLHQARQEPRERLAGSGRRDQQHGAAGARLCQQFELMRARGPAAAREPAGERLGAEHRCRVPKFMTSTEPRTVHRTDERFLVTRTRRFAGNASYFVASAFSTKAPVWVFDRSTVAPPPRDRTP